MILEALIHMIYLSPNINILSSLEEDESIPYLQIMTLIVSPRIAVFEASTDRLSGPPLSKYHISDTFVHVASDEFYHSLYIEETVRDSAVTIHAKHAYHQGIPL